MKKKKAEKEISGIKIATIIVFWILVILLISYMLTSENFNLKNINIEGNKQITNEEVLNKINFKKEKNIFLQNIFKAKSNLKKMQNVEDASVRIVGFDTIRVRIKERKEKFQMSTEDGYYTLDASGYILRKTNQKQKITMLSGFKTDPKTENRLNNRDLHILENMNKIYEVSEKLQIDALITEILYDESNYILSFDNEKKKAILKSELDDLTTQITLIKEILLKEKGKEGEIYQEKNEEKNWMIFREKV